MSAMDLGGGESTEDPDPPYFEILKRARQKDLEDLKYLTEVLEACKNTKTFDDRTCKKAAERVESIMKKWYYI
jgi:plasmid rolling circle replication initiator protein Rep